MRLCEDAADIHGYSNTEVTDALQQAFYAIFEILRGMAPHPVISLFEEGRSLTIQGAEKIAEFHDQYPVPLLWGDVSLMVPWGDVSLMVPYIDEMQRRLLKAEFSTRLQHANIHTLVQGPGALLFRLVILRLYMRRQPSDDDEIYRLFVTSANEVRELEIARKAEEDKEAKEGEHEQKPCVFILQ